MQGFIQRWGGGRGGFIPLMILARGEYPPHQTAEQCFFYGHFSVLQESVQKTNPLFLANLCFLIVCQSEINNYENLTILFIRFLDMNQLLSALNFTIIYCPNNPSIWCQIVLGLCIYLNFRPDCYRCSCQFRVVFAEKGWNFHGRFSRDLRSQMLGKRISGGPEIKNFWGTQTPRSERAPPP